MVGEVQVRSRGAEVPVVDVSVGDGISAGAVVRGWVVAVLTDVGPVEELACGFEPTVVDERPRLPV